MRRVWLAYVAAVFCGLVTVQYGIAEDELQKAVDAALERAGDNRSQLEQALSGVSAEQQPGMRFLVAHMPERDLTSLSAEFLIENVQYAYRARDEAPWKVNGAEVSDDIFFNNVLPYASINERRDQWRKDFHERFSPLVKELPTASKAAAALNRELFPLLKVKYSTERRKPDQSPYESIESGLASCTGLSVLLVDACRAVGIPARIVGTPRWTDNSGNHTWVEIWDDGWHFTGACEPAGDALDQAWFIDRASQALRDDPRHAIFATSFKSTGQAFPLAWRRRSTDVPGVNVTDRYTALRAKLPEGHVRVRFRALETVDGGRVSAPFVIRDAAGTTVFEGTTNDERFDTNDHVTVPLAQGAAYRIELRDPRESGRTVSQDLTPDEDGELITLALTDAEPQAAVGALDRLRDYLTTAREQRPALAEQSFATTPLSREEAEAAAALLREDHASYIRQSRVEEMKKRVLRDGKLEMPFFYEVFGDKPAKGRSLFISLHGGGNAPARVNDRQWENQKKLYEPEEGVYLAPRAPTNTWNLWHEGHIDRLFDRLIENLVVFEEVDPNRVYIMGYSAGGDGVYQLAPRMADRLAAAAMMAGHPNEASPLGLRNIGFTLHVGGDDGAYNRNQVAADWARKLADLQKTDPDGYVHLAKIYPGKGHWLDREDAVAVPWMAQFTRNPFPRQIVWWQDDVTHPSFYWLGVDKDREMAGARIDAKVDGQKIQVETTDVDRVRVRLNDELVNLDEEIAVYVGETKAFSGKVPRTIALLAGTLAERGDPASLYCAEVSVERPQAAGQ